MNILTLLHNTRDAVADDAATKAWCQTNYSRDHWVYVGIDVRKPPPELVYPLVHIFPLSKVVGYQLTAQDHGIGANCGINNADTTVTGKSNVVELTGIEHIETFRKLVETAIVGANLLTGLIETLNIEYETLEFFPFFLASQEFKISHDYSKGDDVFG